MTYSLRVITAGLTDTCNI